MSQGRAVYAAPLAGACLFALAVLPCTGWAAAPIGSSLSGELSVTPGGAANYSLPLITPPGILKPSLSIGYSSQAGNGPVGMGWSLGGLSQISRCPRVKTIDGVDDGIIGFTSNDRLCLDGQRLILKSGSAYGADGAEYRTQMESFTKVVGYGEFGSAGAWFKVWSKSGGVSEFGNSADSRVLGTPTGTTTAVPYAWAANKVSDRFTNYYTISYLQDSGVAYPKQVKYSGNTAAGTAPARTVVFDWAEASARPDPIPLYVGAGIRPSMRYRLQSISNDANPARYKLSYTLSGGGLSNMTKVQYCPDGTDTNCLAVDNQYGYDKDPATGKLMTDPQLVLAQFGSSQGWSDMNIYPRDLADVNGDGRLDVVGFASDGVYVAFGTATGFSTAVNKLSAFGVSAGGWANNSQYPRMVEDVNGDGLADIVGFASTGVYVSLSTGTGFAQPAVWIAAYGTTAGGWTNQDDYPRALADVNGDGLPDIVGFAAGTVAVALNTGTSFVSSPAFSTLTTFTKNAGWATNDRFPRMLADMNSDGKTDIVGFGSTGVSISLASASGFTVPKLSPSFIQSTDTKPPKSPAWASQAYNPRYLTDFDGDGLLDVIGVKFDYFFQVRYISGLPRIIGAASNEPDIYLSLNNGNILSSPLIIKARIDTGYHTADGTASWDRAIADAARYFTGSVNSDGRSDLVLYKGSCVQLFKSTGTSFAAQECLATGFTAENGGWTSATPRMLADLNGDGAVDLFGFGTGGIQVAYSTAKSPTKILSLKNDLTESTITYSSLVDSNVYQKSSGAVYPVVDLQVPQTVVSAITTPDGIGGLAKTLYRYGGLRAHRDYGSQGFGWQESMNSTTGSLSRSAFNQDFPLTGTLKNTQSQHCSGTAQVPWTGCELLSQEISDWTASETGATPDRKIYLPQIQKTVESSWLKSSSAP